MAYSWWWGSRRGEGEGLSILELVNSGTLDCKLAALLWLLMERRASILVAAGPSWAGKTTLLHALLDFLPPEARQVPLKGHFEDFSFLAQSQPSETYMVAEEISNHGYYEYLWGQQALRTFKLLPQGYGLGATIHARSAEEVAFVLHRMLGIPLDAISHLDLVITLRVTAGRDYDDEPVRRINAVELLLPHEDSLAVQALAAQQGGENGFAYPPQDVLLQALIRKGLAGKCRITTEIDTRRHILKHMLDQSQTSRQAVRSAVVDYYRTRPAIP